MIKQTASPLAGSRRPSWPRILVGGLLAAFLIYLLVREYPLPSALELIGGTQPLWLLLSLAAVAANGLARAQRWRLLFPSEQTPPGPGQAYGVLMAGQLLNAVLPLRSGDISRAYLAGRHRGASTMTAAATIGAEKLIDISALGLLLAVLVPFFVLPAWLQTNLPGLYVTIALAFAIWVGLILALPLAEKWVSGWAAGSYPLASLAGRLRNLLRGLSALRQRRRLPQILAWSLLVWLASIATTYFLLLAFHLPVDLPAAILVVVIIQGGISVPVAPGNIGVFEWLAVLALRAVDVPGDQALAFGLLLHGVVLLLPVLVGIPWLWRATR